MARYHVYMKMCIKHINYVDRSKVEFAGSNVFFLFKQQHSFIRVYKPEYLACESFFAPIVA